ncbi:hypothetical protein [Calidithermus timidus]|jgi:hypothetical protein|uniref:hypothetical protein n=1 Tax=Calidithermus timidus TaxID=307124 RepID=UPI0003A26C65|nr:hypothetical protein [Calidithermus timidus]
MDENQSVAMKLAELLLLAARAGSVADVAADPNTPPNTTVECPCCGSLVESTEALANPVTPVLLALCPRGNPLLSIPDTNYAVCRSGNALVVLDADQ